ncbi:MAG: TRAP transporter TatT component family protein [Gammaproteobacteria bacterium]|nr:TRAP transporter TatT component family protein [Gammaproteobacteria bacterium]
MKNYLKLGILLYTLSQLSACSLSQLTVRASMPMIEGGITAMNMETDLALASSAIPANISLIEGMLINDPGNEKLRLFAAQAYYGYAFGFVEDSNPGRAARLYDRGYQHARLVLLNQGLNEQQLTGDLENLQQSINKLDKDAVPALFWAASCQAKSIDLTRDNARSLAQLPKAVMFMQRVLELDEQYFMSGAHVFFGVYYGSKSPMLGGNYKLSEQHFAQANQDNQNKLLVVNLLRAQYLERQRFDQQTFHDLLTRIIHASNTLYPEQALINEISRRKASLLLEKEEQWF